MNLVLPKGNTRVRMKLDQRERTKNKHTRVHRAKRKTKSTQIHTEIDLNPRTLDTAP